MAGDSALESVDEKPQGGFLRFLFLAFFFLSLLVVFALVKAPQPKIHAWLLGTINQQMNPVGFHILADEGHIVLGFGLQYEMTDVRLVKITNRKSLKFSHLEVAPAIAPLLQGKLGGTFRLEDEGSGTISGAALAKGEDFEVTLALEKIDLGKMGILPFAADIEGTANIDGTIELAGNTNQVTGLSGKIDLILAKIVVDGQKVQNFDIPRTAINDGVISLVLGSGKATITTFRLGKPSGNDDLNGVMTGNIKLNKMIENSDADLKLKFGFTDRYKQEKTISLLDSLLGQYRHADGTFGMKFTGPISAAQPLPDL